jgi:hypothetical protein
MPAPNDDLGRSHQEGDLTYRAALEKTVPNSVPIPSGNATTKTWRFVGPVLVCVGGGILITAVGELFYLPPLLNPGRRIAIYSLGVLALLHPQAELIGNAVAWFVVLALATVGGPRLLRSAKRLYVSHSYLRLALAVAAAVTLCGQVGAWLFGNPFVHVLYPGQLFCQLLVSMGLPEAFTSRAAELALANRGQPLFAFGGYWAQTVLGLAGTFAFSVVGLYGLIRLRASMQISNRLLVGLPLFIAGVAGIGLAAFGEYVAATTLAFSYVAVIAGLWLIAGRRLLGWYRGWRGSPG